MKTSIQIFVLLILTLSGISHAGSFSRSVSSYSSVAASINVEGYGLHNVVVGVHILKEPYEDAPYDNDEYERLIKRIETDWKQVCLDTIMEKSTYKLEELEALKDEVLTRIKSHANESKRKYGVKQNAEVVFSINHFVLEAIGK